MKAMKPSPLAFFSRRSLAIGIFGSLALTACQLSEVTCNSECQDEWMDGPVITDASFTNLLGQMADSSVRVSTRFLTPDSVTLAKNIIITVHGYTASTFEWIEFAEAAEAADTNLLVSRVLMGGHGSEIDAFTESTWQEWGEPILAEFDSLSARGYKKISLAGSSTGGALLLHFLSVKAFRERIAPKQIYFIDPIVLPSPKLLSLAKLVGPIVGNSPTSGSTDLEQQNWYTNRPAETLDQLYELVNKVKNRLEEGFALPVGTQAKLFKAKVDALADPAGALLIYKGLREADGTYIDVEMVDSRKHVFTRLRGREPSSMNAADTARQQAAFSDMIQRLKESVP
jgi:carboxylesterase